METMDLYKFRINNIVDIFALMLLRNPNIVGVGCGNKTINGYNTFKPALVFFVIKKVAISSLDNINIIPKYINGVVTDVVETGAFNTLKSNSYKENPVLKRQGTDNPIALGGGCLISEVKTESNDPWGGTLTYAVKDRATKSKVYFLASGHLLRLKKPISLGTNIYYAKSRAPNDLLNRFLLGFVAKTIAPEIDPKTRSLVSKVDAGIGYVGLDNPETRKKINRGLLNGSIITGTELVQKGTKVYKLGASTGMTTGTIKEVNFIVKLKDEAKEHIMSNQIIVTQVGAPGDSGSLGVIEGTTKAFGMLNSGNENVEIYSPIDDVLKALDVEFLYN